MKYHLHLLLLSSFCMHAVEHDIKKKTLIGRMFSKFSRHKTRSNTVAVTPCHKTVSNLDVGDRYHQEAKNYLNKGYNSIAQERVLESVNEYLNAINQAKTKDEKENILNKILQVMEIASDVESLRLQKLGEQYSPHQTVQTIWPKIRKVQEDLENDKPKIQPSASCFQNTWPKGNTKKAMIED